MSQTLSLARPYARAAFALANESGSLAAWSQQLATAAAIAADERVGHILGNPGVRVEVMAGVVAVPGQTEAFGRFLAVLAENRRLPLLPEITALFEALRAEAERVVRAKVTSAQPLGEAELAKLVDGLKRRFGREVQVTTAVDEALIGGAVIDTGDMVIDGSVRSKLARLGATLSH
ncbi:MAG: F0F1 ATP synthase subunit delta [Lysobacteraceae bacterium]